jgi:hypothetical protein
LHHPALGFSVRELLEEADTQGIEKISS